jgi:hypothetical protein
MQIQQQHQQNQEQLFQQQQLEQMQQHQLQNLQQYNSNDIFSNLTLNQYQIISQQHNHQIQTSSTSS